MTLKFMKEKLKRQTKQNIEFVKKCLRRSARILYFKKIENCSPVKYLHILGHSELKFNEVLVDTINSNELPFFKKEHMFVTPHWDVYYALRKHDNIYFISKWNAQVLNKLGDYGRWIFIHALNLTQNEIANISRDVAVRIVWRTWGHDMINYRKLIQEENDIKQKKVLEKSYLNIKKFYAIGGAGIDRININECIGESRFFVMPYSFADILDEFKEKTACYNQTIKILVGHYAARGDRLLESLEQLLKFRNEDIQIYLITSYATLDKEYLKDVYKYALDKFGDKVVFIDKFLPRNDYYRFLQSIDIAIMDQLGSSALANIAWLLFFDKKICVNRNGIIKKAFDIYGLDYVITDDISNMKYEDFIKPIHNSYSQKYDLICHDKKENLEYWRIILDSLKQAEKGAPEDAKN